MSHKHYSLDRKRAACDVYRAALEAKSVNPKFSLSPMSLASTAAGGASKREIFRWLKEDLSDDAIESREEDRGRHPLYSDDQLRLLIGHAVEQRSLHRAVHLKALLNFSKSYLGVVASNATISEIMKNHGFSSQKSRKRNSRMVSEEVVQAAVEAIEEIRSYDFPPHRILCMDETGVWSNTVTPRTYNFVNWCATSISIT
jgi:hypothetical protein